MSAHTEDELRGAVVAMEDRRYAAMMAGDVDGLADLLDDNLVYIHSTGSADTKDAYLQTISSGFVQYLEVDHPVDKTIVIGDVVVVYGRMHANARVGGEPRELSNLCIAVWRCDGETPVLVTLQATPAPKG